MSNPNVRWLGQVHDIDGVHLKVGVDFDSVNVDGRRLNRSQAETFARLFIVACWEAGRCAVETELVDS